MTTKRVDVAGSTEFEVRVVAPSDPTGETVQFAVVTETQNSSDIGSWTAGTWSGTYSGGAATAVTPTLGKSGAGIELTRGTTYRLYGQVDTASGADPVQFLGLIDAV